nr:hypothetical protein [Paenibacillus gorillae]
MRKSVDRPIVTAGETVFFTIRVENNGNIELTNFIIEDSLLGLSLRTARFRIGSIITIRIPFIAPEVEEDTIIVNTVTGRSDTTGSKNATASVLVQSQDDE